MSNCYAIEDLIPVVDPTAYVHPRAVLIGDVIVGPPRSLMLGAPARIIRPLTDHEIAWKRNGTREYQELVVRRLASQRRVDPLRAVQPDRPRYRGGSTVTLGSIKASMK
jgi:carbonic anhydrase/acetyltransferase-like protein (isoleucine patch superfamily)